jgi:predicted metal-dependent hydrolase
MINSLSPIDTPIPHPAQYLRFFELFNERSFYDAHEELEDLWIMEVGPEKNFYKGLIMMAISLEHLLRGRLEPAQRLHRDARVYLLPYPRVYKGMDLGDFLLRMEKILSKAAQQKASGNVLTHVEEHPTLKLIN